MPLTRGQKSDRTQWSATFAAAGELRRRNYQVALFLGNVPRYDAMCTGVFSGQSFPVQIKGFAAKPPQRAGAPGVFVPIGDLDSPQRGDIFVIVYVPKPDEPFRLYIATRGSLADISQARRQADQRRGSRFYQGIHYDQFVGFQDKWCNLPNA